MLTSSKQKSLKSARQAAGIAQKVVAMVESDVYCPEVIQQVEAVSGLFNAMKKELLVGHLNHCLDHKLKENRSKTISELLRIYDLSK